MLMHSDVALDLISAIAFVIACGVVVWLFFFPIFVRDRVAARDHAVAVARDVAIPIHCASCRSPHASQPIGVRTMFIGIPPLVQIMDRGRFKREFTFHFCIHCALPIRRRRAHGRVIMIAGWLLLALTLPFVLLLGGGPSLILLPLNILVAPLIVGAGFWMQLYSPAVGITDFGEERIVFRFKSQLFCDEFAALNGEATSPRSTSPASRP